MKVVISTLERKATKIRVGQIIKVLDDAHEGSLDTVSVQFSVGTFGKLFAFQLEKETTIHHFKRQSMQRSYHTRSQIGVR